jgi:hypothetical protein
MAQSHPIWLDNSHFMPGIYKLPDTFEKLCLKKDLKNFDLIKKCKEQLVI